MVKGDLLTKLRDAFLHRRLGRVLSALAFFCLCVIATPFAARAAPALADARDRAAHEKICSQMGISLHDHLIVTRAGAYSIKLQAPIPATGPK